MGSYVQVFKWNKFKKNDCVVKWEIKECDNITHWLFASESERKSEHN